MSTPRWMQGKPLEEEQKPRWMQGRPIDDVDEDGIPLPSRGKVRKSDILPAADNVVPQWAQGLPEMAQQFFADGEQKALDKWRERIAYEMRPGASGIELTQAPTPETIEDLAQKRWEQAGRKAPKQDIAQTTAGLAGFADMATFGLNKDFAASMYAVDDLFAGKGLKQAGQTYGQVREDMKALNSEGYQQRPGSTLTGQAVAMLAPGGKVYEAGMQMAPKLVPKAVSSLASGGSRVARGARYTSRLVPMAGLTAADYAYFNATAGASNEARLSGTEMPNFAERLRFAADEATKPGGVIAALSGPALSMAYRTVRAPVAATKNTFEATRAAARTAPKADVAAAGIGKLPEIQWRGGSFTPTDVQARVDIGMSGGEIVSLRNQAIDELLKNGFEPDAAETAVRLLSYNNMSEVPEALFEVSPALQEIAVVAGRLHGKPAHKIFRQFFDDRAEAMPEQLRTALRTAVRASGDDFEKFVASMKQAGRDAADPGYRAAHATQVSDDTWGNILHTLGKQLYTATTKAGKTIIKGEPITAARLGAQLARAGARGRDDYFAAAAELESLALSLERGALPNEKLSTVALDFLDRGIGRSVDKAMGKNDKAFASSLLGFRKDYRGSGLDKDTGLNVPRTLYAQYETVGKAAAFGEKSAGRAIPLRQMKQQFINEMRNADEAFEEGIGEGSSIIDTALLQGWVRGAENAIDMAPNPKKVLTDLYGTPRQREKLLGMMRELPEGAGSGFKGDNTKRIKALVGSKPGRADYKPTFKLSSGKDPKLGDVEFPSLFDRQKNMLESERLVYGGSPTGGVNEAMANQLGKNKTVEGLYNMVEGIYRAPGRFIARQIDMRRIPLLREAGASQEIGNLLTTNGKERLLSVIDEIRQRAIATGKLAGPDGAPPATPPPAGPKGGGFAAAREAGKVTPEERAMLLGDPDEPIKASGFAGFGGKRASGFLDELERGAKPFHDERLGAQGNNWNKSVEMAKNGYSNDEIAEALDIGAASVAMYLSRARRLGIDIPKGVVPGRAASTQTGTIDDVLALKKKGRTPGQISQITGKPVSTVKSMLSQARDRMRKAGDTVPDWLAPLPGGRPVANGFGVEAGQFLGGAAGSGFMPMESSGDFGTDVRNRLLLAATVGTVAVGGPRLAARFGAKAGGDVSTAGLGGGRKPPAADAPLSRAKFEREYMVHKDIRGREAGTSKQNAEAIARDGFKRGANVNAMPPYKGGEPKTQGDRFAPRKGDTIYLVPKSHWKDAPNGVQVQDGWKPKPHEIIEVTEDFPDVYALYKSALKPTAQQGVTAQPEKYGIKPEQVSRINPIYRPEQLPPAKMKSNQEAALWLEKKYEGEPITDLTAELTPKQVEDLSDVMAAEVQLALEKTGNAVNWYTSSMDEALNVASVKYRMLTDDAAAELAGFGNSKNARFVFTFIKAITSQNLDVNANVIATDKAFSAMLDRVRAGNYTMPKSWGTGDKQKAMGLNFEKFGKLIDAMPGEDFPSKLADLDLIFRKKMTVSEWEKFAKKEGMPFNAPGQTAKDAEVYGSSMLGPKIGNGFWQNLNGNYDPLTIDLWKRRTWGRLTGKSIGNPEALPEQRSRLSAAVKRSRSRDQGKPDHISAMQEKISSAERQLQSLNRSDYPTQKEFAAAQRSLRAEIDDGREMLADIANLKAPEGWNPQYGKSDTELLAYAKRLLKVWDAEYKRLRTMSNSGEVPAELQPTWARAAKTIVTNLAKPLDQVANGTQRKQIEKVTARAIQKLADRGTDIKTADLQAALWYPEKELWGSLTDDLLLDVDGIPIPSTNPLNTSYDTAWAELLGKQGYEIPGAKSTGSGRGGADGAVSGPDVRPARPQNPKGAGKAGGDVAGGRRLPKGPIRSAGFTGDIDLKAAGRRLRKGAGILDRTLAQPVTRGIQKLERRLASVDDPRNYGPRLADLGIPDNLDPKIPLYDQIADPAAAARILADNAAIKGGTEGGNRAISYVAGKRNQRLADAISNGDRSASVRQRQAAGQAYAKALKDVQSFFGPDGDQRQFKTIAARRTEQARRLKVLREAGEKVGISKADQLSPQRPITEPDREDMIINAMQRAERPPGYSARNQMFAAIKTRAGNRDTKGRPRGSIADRPVALDREAMRVEPAGQQMPVLPTQRARSGRDASAAVDNRTAQMLLDPEMATAGAYAARAGGAGFAPRPNLGRAVAALGAAGAGSAAVGGYMAVADKLRQNAENIRAAEEKRNRPVEHDPNRREPVSPRDPPPNWIRMSSNDRMRIQMTLNKENGFQMPTDYAWGGQMMRGIEEFQEREGLPVTGDLDDATLKAINAAHYRHMMEFEYERRQSQPTQELQ